MSLRAAFCFVICLGPCFFTGCRGNTPANNPPASSSPAATSAAPELPLAAALSSTLKTSEPITSGEYYDFCKQAEAEAAAGDADALSRRFDVDAMLATTLAGMQVSQKTRQQAEQGFKQALGNRGLAFQIIRETKEGGSWKVLHVHKQQGATLAWFRIVSAAGMNYHHLLLQKNAQGEIKIADVYIMMAGEMLTTVFRRNMLPIVTKENRTLLDKLTSSESDYVKHLDAVLAFQTAIGDQRYPEARQMYQALPASVQGERNLLLMNIIACNRIGDVDAQLQGLEQLQAQMPDDASADLMSIDLHLNEKNFPAVFAAIDRIDAAVGGDPRLQLVRATALIKKGDIAEAKALILKEIERSPTDLDPYWVLVEICLKEQNHEDTLHWLKTIHQTFAMEFDDMTQIPEYAEFVKSPQYGEFLKFTRAAAR